MYTLYAGGIASEGWGSLLRRLRGQEIGFASCCATIDDILEWYQGLNRQQIQVAFRWESAQAEPVRS